MSQKMLTRLKQQIERILTAEAKAAHKIGLTPNIVTAIGIVLALLAALAYTQWQTNRLYLLLATLFLLFSGFCDALDGTLARLYQQTTAFGGFLDSLLDRYADAAVFIAIIVSGLCEQTSGLIALTGSLLVSYTRAKAEATNIKMETIGIAERAERIIILMIASLIAIYWQPATAPMTAAAILLAVLTNLTVLQRSVHIYNKLKKKETS
jgi:archaetidylinositol phosphate synthase